MTNPTMTTVNKGFVGNRLRIARLFLGVSQTELGQQVDASRQYIHQLENGSKQPSSDMANALATAVGVAPVFFNLSVSNPVSEDQCHFRKLKTTPVSAARQVVALGTLFDELVNFIDSKLELPKYDFPDLDVESNEDIEQVAEECRARWHLGLSSPISNMTRVVENAGAIVAHFEGVSEKVDALSISRPRPIIIRSSAKESACRLRFDIAHECGHLVMHQGIETGDKVTESQAHRFASAFLLPRAAFCQEFPRYGRLHWPAIYELKVRWKVSVGAIIRRAADLGLIDAIAYRKANIYLSKRGQRKGEDRDDEVPFESPELLKKSFEALNIGYGLTYIDIATALGVTPKFLCSLTGIQFDENPPFDQGGGGNVIRFPTGIRHSVR